jgi:16S rRNA (guanine527-N7)-methyltransferase
MISDFEKLRSFIERCGVPDVESFIKKCTEFKSILYAENEKHNLTRITDEFEFWNRHIADSVSMGLYFKDLLLKPLFLADVGCGAGFPSIPLALAFPWLNVTAIDSTGKKTAFVSFAAKNLGISNLNVMTGRARELKIDSKFDIVTARAVGEPVKIFKEVRSWLKIGGKIILYQTPQNVSEEQLSDLNKQPCSCRFLWTLTSSFTLPGGENRIFLSGESGRR